MLTVGKLVSRECVLPVLGQPPPLPNEVSIPVSVRQYSSCMSALSLFSAGQFIFSYHRNWSHYAPLYLSIRNVAC